jgi:hypothetical protein
LRSIRLRPLVIAALLLSAFLPATAEAEESSDPWETLERVRAVSETAGILSADFDQSYIPAGFDTAEKRSGRMFMELPDCLRVEYSEPYPESYLICGGVVHAWNPEDGSGRRYLVDPEDEPGLDLLLLSTGELRRRYQATVEEGTDGALEILLEPHVTTERLREAAFTVRPQSHRIVGIRYRDADGGATTFELENYQAVEGRDVFTAPRDIEWQGEK